jgi:amino acid transporter
LSNGFGAFKLIMLSLLVCTGFAALAGKTAAPRPDNFSSFHGAGSSRSPDDNPTGAAGGYSIALLQVLYSYSGWENANYVGHAGVGQRGWMTNRPQVLTEVRNAPKTLRKAAPISISAVTILYVLANISYVRAHRFR